LPHFEQNTAPGATGLAQRLQNAGGGARLDPHFPQKAAPSAFSALQRRQFTGRET
jgi:hypothetical protein